MLHARAARRRTPHPDRSRRPRGHGRRLARAAWPRPGPRAASVRPPPAARAGERPAHPRPTGRRRSAPGDGAPRHRAVRARRRTAPGPADGGSAGSSSCPDRAARGRPAPRRASSRPPARTPARAAVSPGHCERAAPARPATNRDPDAAAQARLGHRGEAVDHPDREQWLAGQLAGQGRAARAPLPSARPSRRRPPDAPTATGRVRERAGCAGTRHGSRSGGSAPAPVVTGTVVAQGSGPTRLDARELPARSAKRRPPVEPEAAPRRSAGAPPAGRDSGPDEHGSRPRSPRAGRTPRAATPGRRLRGRRAFGPARHRTGTPTKRPHRDRRPVEQREPRTCDCRRTRACYRSALAPGRPGRSAPGSSAGDRLVERPAACDPTTPARSTRRRSRSGRWLTPAGLAPGRLYPPAWVDRLLCPDRPAQSRPPRPGAGPRPGRWATSVPATGRRAARGVTSWREVRAPEAVACCAPASASGRSPAGGRGTTPTSTGAWTFAASPACTGDAHRAARAGRSARLDTVVGVALYRLVIVPADFVMATGMLRGIARRWPTGVGASGLQAMMGA